MTSNEYTKSGSDSLQAVACAELIASLAFDGDYGKLLAAIMPQTVGAAQVLRGSAVAAERQMGTLMALEVISNAPRAPEFVIEALRKHLAEGK